MQKNLSAAEMKTALDGAFSACCDYTLRESELPCGVKIYVASFLGLCDKAYISESVTEPLFKIRDKAFLKESLFALGLLEVFGVEKVKNSLLFGNVVVFFELDDKLSCLVIDAKSSLSRSVSEPESEVVVRGPREGFVESAVANVALLRKRLTTQSLCIEKMTVGNVCPAEIYLVYIDGIADSKTIEKIKSRISKTDLPSVMDSGYIEHALCDCRYPLFPDVGNSEKPDKVAAKLVGGRVAVICDGSPTVLTLPYFFVESLQSAEDYLKSPYYATFLRILRLLGTFIAIFLPAVYIALLEFDVSAIPHNLYMTIKEARNDIPFTPFTELVVLLIVFEIIREVGVRMPRAVGNAVSIVAGIILGDAAIKAGIASAPVIMVAALSATCSFIDPPIMNPLPLLRLACLVFARIFGLFGVAFFMLLLAAALCVKTSVGKPYLSPFAPISKKGLADGILVIPDVALKGAPDETKEAQ